MLLATHRKSHVVSFEWHKYTFDLGPFKVKVKVKVKAMHISTVNIPQTVTDRANIALANK